MKVQRGIEQKLKAHFQPLYLEVVNESHNHKVPAGSESHFKVLLVSELFRGKPSVSRHRLVNHILANELKSTIHALTMKLMTPEQWENAGRVIESQSPPCANA